MSFLGSLKKAVTNVGKTVAKAATDTTHAVTKAAVDTAHVAGTVATSKIGQAVIGTALAATGVGAPVAIALGAGIKATGNLIKPGGNLGKAATGAYQGAALGAGAAVVGSGARALLGGKGLGGFAKMVVGGKDAANEAPKIANEVLVTDAVIEERQPMVAPPEVTPSGITKMPDPIPLRVKNAPGDLVPRMTDPTPVDKARPKEPRKFHNLTQVSERPKMESPAAIESLPIEATPAPAGSNALEPKNNMMLYAAAAAAVVLVVVLAASGRKAAA